MVLELNATITPLPYAYNQTGLDSVFTYANTVTSGWITYGFLIGLWIVIYSYLESKGSDNALVAASTLIVIPAVIIGTIDPTKAMIIPVAVVAWVASVIMKIMTKN